MAQQGDEEVLQSTRATNLQSADLGVGEHPAVPLTGVVEFARRGVV